MGRNREKPLTAFELLVHFWYNSTGLILGSVLGFLTAHCRGSDSLVIGSDPH